MGSDSFWGQTALGSDSFVVTFITVIVLWISEWVSPYCPLVVFPIVTVTFKIGYNAILEQYLGDIQLCQ
jgi:hypothetical protein